MPPELQDQQGLQALQDQILPAEKQDAEFAIKHTLVGKIRGWRQGLSKRWATLHTNQVIYTVALVLFFVTDGDINDPNSLRWYVGVLAFFGMARELWAIFLKVWDSTFGRLVLLVIYAAIANFTIAVAAQKVNIVINADPTQLYHTLGVTTLLVLPLWLMVVSVVGMIVIFGFMQILRLIRGLFIFMRIIGRKTKPKEAFPRTFIVVRLILLLPISMTVFNSLVWYGEQLNLPNSSGLSFASEPSGIVNEQATKVGIDIIENELQKENISDEERNKLISARQNLLKRTGNNNIDRQLADNVPVEREAVLNDVQNTLGSAPISEAPTEIYVLDKLIASFVYNFEAFEYSHCQKGPNERVVYISENDILVVKKDKSTRTGYGFSTRSCHQLN
jgi:hypothetical protein